MFGVLNINKPYGWTSRDVVNRVQRLVHPAKAGHAGTLDPLATGVLLVAVGQATRLIQYSHRLPKQYRATFLLGRRSETEDLESPVEELVDAPVPTARQVRTAAAQLVGEVSQRPSRHSAIKVGGRRAYELARSGIKFVLEPRTVLVHSLEVVHYHYPELILEVECGAGTYIRALGRDLAAALDTCAVMTSLERTSVGLLHVSRAVSVEALLSGCEPHLITPTHLVDALEWLTVNRDEMRKLRNGQPIEKRHRRIEIPSMPTGVAYDEIAAADADKNLVAILHQRKPGELWPIRNFSQPE
jgi:tRNA pseudouridine55 synthase